MRSFISCMVFATLLFASSHWYAAAEEGADKIATSAVLTESSDGVPIAVTFAGNPEGPELLFVHGYMASTLNWTKQLNSELASTHKLVFVDIRGHGSSGKPWDRDAYMSTQLFADDIAAAIKAADLKNPVIVSLSYGGLFMMDYLRHYGTGNVAGAVIVSGNGGLLKPPPPAEKTPEYMARIERSRSVDIFEIRDWTNAFVEYLGGDTTLSDDDIEILRVSAMLVPHHVRRYLRDRPQDHSPIADDLNIPVLLISGVKAGAATSGDIAKVAEKLERAEVILYDDLGGMINWHAADRFNSDLKAFSDRVQ